MIEYALSDDIEYRLWREWCCGKPWTLSDDFEKYIKTKLPSTANVYKQPFDSWIIEFADPKDLTLFLLKYS